VISFLLKEFSEAKYAKDKFGCTPLMCYLINGGPHDSDVLESLSPGKVEFIADWKLAGNCGRKIDEATINVDRAVWRLDNHNPSLRGVKMADNFFEIAGCEFFDIMDAIYCNPHIRTFYFIYGHHNLFLREEGMRRNAFSVLLSKKMSIKSITIELPRTELTHFGDILEDCMHLEHLTIEATWRCAFERNTIEMIIKSVNNLPRLLSVSFVNTVITHHDGIAIAQWLIGERSMEGLKMMNCVIESRAASAIIDALKTDNDCTLRDVSLFIGNEERWVPNKDQEIRLCLSHNARV
jgi:hypothetical protein